MPHATVPDASRGPDSPPQRAALHRLRAFAVVAGLAQALAGAAGALLARAVGGSEAVAGLPQTMLTLGSAAAALPLGALAGRWGRGRSLAAGCLLAAGGCAVVVVAARAGVIAGVLVGTAALGAGNTAVMLARYAGAELAPEGGRARAMAGVLVATTVGAVAGPNLLAVAPALLGAGGEGVVPALVSAYVVAGVAFLGAAALVAGIGAGTPLAPGSAPRTRPRSPMGPSARAGVAVLAVSNLVMVGVMTMAPLHLHHAGLGLAGIGLVVSAHIAGMFAPAPLSGWLVHRLGARAVAALAAALFAGSCLLAGAATHRGVLVAALVLLGIAWNMALVAGSELLTSDASPAERPRREGIGEVGAALAAVVGGFGSGLLMAGLGYAGLAAVGAVVGATVVLPVVLAGRPAARLPGAVATGADVVPGPHAPHQRLVDGSPRGG